MRILFYETNNSSHNFSTLMYFTSYIRRKFISFFSSIFIRWTNRRLPYAALLRVRVHYGFTLRYLAYESLQFVEDLGNNFKYVRLFSFWHWRNAFWIPHYNGGVYSVTFWKAYFFKKIGISCFCTLSHPAGAEAFRCGR